MVTFLQQIILGLREGSLFSLVALGLVLIYKTSGVVNFAYGNMGMFAAYIAYTVFAIAGLPLWLAVLTAIVFGFFLGAATERGLLRPIRHLSHSAMLILTLGLLMILEGLALEIWKQDYKPFPSLIHGRPIFIKFPQGRIILTKQDLLIFGIAAVIMLALFLYFKFTRVGLSVRATAQNETAARLMGIRVGTVFAFSWGVGTALSALAAIMAAPRTQINPNMMLDLQIQGLIAAVLGGFESLPGTVVGGLLLGIIEQFVARYLSEELKMAFALLIILILLLIKPEGLLGRRSAERV
ncbi:MAG: branched-chain amino acid ABC transporter permease [Kosmotoga sp.]|uniref:branched-chain amino acid ABC transporter permease n=1 Tax=Kosmotoga sp. TaxID=1955248 RepID=UPI001DE1B128|nr:branched-chain amino acid ABC transporter permease [Kosmotoga sp.]MBO8166663.1 branched-chain amino acid ABC transporter permease [Kosmotoga sp.]